MSTIKELSEYEAYPVYKIPTDGTIKIVKAEGQRKPLTVSLERLQRAIDKCNLLKQKPINAVWYKGELIVFDGWHRYISARVIGLEAFFIVVTEDEYDEEWMAYLNSCQQNWKPIHFADMYSKGKDENKSRIYTKFLEYHKRYTVTAGVLVALYNNKVIRRNKEMQLFKDGLLTEEHHYSDFNDIEFVMFGDNEINARDLNQSFETHGIEDGARLDVKISEGSHERYCDLYDGGDRCNCAAEESFEYKGHI